MACLLHLGNPRSNLPVTPTPWEKSRITLKLLHLTERNQSIIIEHRLALESTPHVQQNSLHLIFLFVWNWKDGYHTKHFLKKMGNMRKLTPSILTFISTFDILQVLIKSNQNTVLPSTFKVSGRVIGQRTFSWDKDHLNWFCQNGVLALPLSYFLGQQPQWFTFHVRLKSIVNSLLNHGEGEKKTGSHSVINRQL